MTALQFVLLGLTMALLDTYCEVLLASLAYRAKGRLAPHPRLQRLQRMVTRPVFILEDLRLATQER